jgi:hypothetical protein
VLDRDVLVPERRHLLLGALEGAHEGLGGADLRLVRAADGGQAGDRFAGAPHDRGQIGADLAKDGRRQSLVLLEHRNQQVRRGDLGVALLGRQPLGGGDGLLGLDGESISLHLRVV